MSKFRYVKCYGASLYIKEIKRHWFSRWTIEKEGGLLPCLYTRLDGVFRLIDYDERFNFNETSAPSANHPTLTPN